MGDLMLLQVLHSGQTAPINLEYLKNCVLRYMQTADLSEHSRLLPVIATILQVCLVHINTCIASLY